MHSAPLERARSPRNWVNSVPRRRPGRIAAGELPFAQPLRPSGIERNVVLTLWDWSRPTAYLHDEISTDRRKPTVNANGILYGTTEESTDFIPILDPERNTATEVNHPVRDPKTPSSKD